LITIQDLLICNDIKLLLDKINGMADKISDIVAIVRVENEELEQY